MIPWKAVQGLLNARQLALTGGLIFMLCFFSGLAFPKLSLSTLILYSIEDTFLFSSEHSQHVMECDNIT